MLEEQITKLNSIQQKTVYGGFGFKPKADDASFEQAAGDSSEKSALTDRSRITDKSGEKADVPASKTSLKP